MRIAEYKQISTETVEREVLIPAEMDDDGNVLSEEHTEIIPIGIPVFGMVYRDATAEEENANATTEDAAPQTVEDRIAELEAMLAALLEGKTE